MVMARGKSFALEQAPPADGSPREEIGVRKAMGPDRGRDFLFERTAYLDLAPLLKGLPEAAARRREMRTFQSAPQANSPPWPPLCPSPLARPGVVLDYVINYTSTTGFTLNPAVEGTLRRSGG